MERIVAGALLLPGNQPLQDGVKVGLFLGTDAVAARLATFEGLEVHFVDELVDGQLAR